MEESAPIQSLFRVHYQGPAGVGGMRLVLRRASPDRFQLDAADLLGRSLWTLRVEGDRLLLADHREKVYCEGRDRIEVPDPVLATLSPRDLRRALEGRLPVPPPAHTEGQERLDFKDSRGRRWTASYDRGELVSWSLWQEGAPVLWWLGVGSGGILSHRDGSQFRWRRGVSEPLADTALARPIAEGYELGTCEIR